MFSGNIFSGECNNFRMHPVHGGVVLRDDGSVRADGPVQCRDVLYRGGVCSCGHGMPGRCVLPCRSLVVRRIRHVPRGLVLGGWSHHFIVHPVPRWCLLPGWRNIFRGVGQLRGGHLLG